MQTYNVSEIDFISEESEEEDCDNKSKCVSTSKEQDTQLGGVEENTQDAEENEEGVRDSPPDSLSSDGGTRSDAKKVTTSKQKRLYTTHRRMTSNMI